MSGERDPLLHWGSGIALPPQVFGLAVSTAGLALCGMSLFRPPVATPTGDSGPR